MFTVYWKTEIVYILLCLFLFLVILPGIEWAVQFVFKKTNRSLRSRLVIYAGLFLFSWVLRGLYVIPSFRILSFLLDMRFFLPLLALSLGAGRYVWMVPIIVLPSLFGQPAIGMFCPELRFAVSLGEVIASCLVILPLQSALRNRKPVPAFAAISLLVLAVHLVYDSTILPLSGLPFSSAGHNLLQTLVYLVLITLVSMFMHCSESCASYPRLSLFLEDQALLDPITGLYNRKGFEKHCKLLMNRQQQLFGVLFHLRIKNLDALPVCSTIGNQNRCQITLADRLTEYARLYKNSVVGCLDNGEFLFYIHGQRSLLEINRVIAKFTPQITRVKVMTDAQTSGGEMILSIGAAVYNRDAIAFSELMNKASFALSLANKRETAFTERFREESYRDHKHRLMVTEAMPGIIAERRFSHLYQPIVDARTGEVCAYETLTRPDPLLNVTISELLDISSDAGLRPELEREMLFAAIEDYKWHGKKNISLCINESAYTLFDENIHMLDTYRDISSGIDLTIEMSERERMQPNVFENKIRALRNISCKISIDDFGAGNGSELVLLQARPDYVKISMALVKEINITSSKYSMVSRLIGHAHYHNVRVIASGIETQEEMETLISLNADFLQGYYICRPLHTVVDIDEKVREQIVEFNQRME